MEHFIVREVFVIGCHLGRIIAHNGHSLGHRQQTYAAALLS